MRNPHNVYNRRRGLVYAAATEDAHSPEMVKQQPWENTYRRLERDRADYGQHRGHDTSVNLFDYVVNPFVTGGANIVTVLSFIVPGGVVLEVKRMGVWFSEPVFHATTAFGWRPTINKKAIPYSGNASGKLSAYYNSPQGDYNNPAETEPIFVQQGSTFELEVFRTNPYQPYLIAAGRVQGALWKLV